MINIMDVPRLAPSCPIFFLLSFFLSGKISMLVNAQSWCIAKASASQESLQEDLDFACGVVDCRPTQQGGTCYEPNSHVHHASFAMNEYYQSRGRHDWDCYFSRTALIALADPSFGSCKLKAGGTGSPPRVEKQNTWCVAKPGTPDNMLGANIKYACGKLSECSDILQHGSCFFPNTLINHASFVMNLYYKTLGHYTCDFNGTGIIVMTDPSYGECIYV